MISGSFVILDDGHLFFFVLVQITLSAVKELGLEMKSGMWSGIFIRLTKIYTDKALPRKISHFSPFFFSPKATNGDRSKTAILHTF